jgi:hypothetical protein
MSAASARRHVVSERVHERRSVSCRGGGGMSRRRWNWDLVVFSEHLLLKVRGGGLLCSGGCAARHIEQERADAALVLLSAAVLQEKRGNEVAVGVAVGVASGQHVDQVLRFIVAGGGRGVHVA